VTRQGETEVKRWSNEEVLFSLILFQFIEVDAK
jgi:hypothetical protein